MTSTRNRGRGDGLALLSPQERYQTALPKLSRVLASPWQRVALGIDALIRGSHLEPGRWVTTLGVNALLTDRTNTFDDLPGVYTKTFVGDVLDAPRTPRLPEPQAGESHHQQIAQRSLSGPRSAPRRSRIGQGHRCPDGAAALGFTGWRQSLGGRCGGVYAGPDRWSLTPRR